DGIRDDLVTGVQTCALPIFFIAPIVSLSQVPSQLDFAVYATGTGCGVITMSGNAYIDSFDSSKGTYTQTKQLSQGIVGASGNIRSEERRVGKDTNRRNQTEG